jgi:hypothetical protein
MTSELHETLVDEIRFSFSRFMHQHGYQMSDNVGFLAEASFANILTGLVGIGVIADGYIFPNDGYGVIPVEVGNMKAGKWSGITTADEKPVRVFRVDFDRSLWILNPRNTQFEGQLMQFYNARLSPSFYSLPLFPESSPRPILF